MGRFSVVLSHLVGVSVASDGVPRWREGVAVALQVSGVSVAHALQMSGGCRGHLVGIGCRCSSLSVGRGVGVLFGWLPLLFVVLLC